MSQVFTCCTVQKLKGYLRAAGPIYEHPPMSLKIKSVWCPNRKYVTVQILTDGTEEILCYVSDATACTHDHTDDICSKIVHL